jgi:hypothetical protein
MFEKIKDFFYDISDIVLSLLIIAVIFYSVSWKISDTLSVDIGAPATTSAGDETPTESPIVVVTPENPGNDSPETTEPTTEPETEPPTQAPLELVTFTVPEGSSGYSIGEKLQSEGFVGDVNAFVKRLIEMGYDNKLRAGDFKLSKSDDMDTLIKVLAGQGR